MTRVVGVRFKKANKVYYFNPGVFNPSVGDQVIVETARGLEIGEVAVRPKEIPKSEVPQQLKDVIRLATDEDVRRSRQQGIKSRDAFSFAFEAIERQDLGMKLIDAEYTLDGSKLTFYFSAEKRVDFRELVKELSRRFRTRIELRQIGIRDEAKMLGGYGICGRPLCCATWISDFEPVSIRHAKEQNLSLNPGKISGVCGRLKCCLRFESDTYREIKKMLPKVGQTVSTSRGTGKVVDVMIVKESVLVQMPNNGDRFEVHASELQDATSLQTSS